MIVEHRHNTYALVVYRYPMAGFETPNDTAQIGRRRLRHRTERGHACKGHIARGRVGVTEMRVSVLFDRSDRRKRPDAFVPFGRRRRMQFIEIRGMAFGHTGL